MASITRRMLHFARRYKPELEHVDVNDVIETTLDMRAYEMKSSNIKVTTELTPELLETMADAGQLQQVFLNIILNAEQEMVEAHKGGNLLVKTERVDDTIKVSIKDDGPGIAKGSLAKIFDPFFTTREVGEGAGLGLSVCHGIVKGHGGKIYAESRLGKGATFIVELPIVTKAEQLRLAEPSAVKPKRVTKARVLVVDDEPIVQQYLTEVLGEEGHEVEIVDNGDDAMDKLGSKDYDVILLDIKLPGISGIEIYKHLQKTAKSLARRVVFITGDVMGRETMAFLSRTAAPYITKPFDAEQMKKDIDSILAQGV
jgi:CheY-like chemotaxis protein